ncbi:MAG: hypothetical protein IKD26_02000, partial [Clostridia bacterium]|nr:hypothetical protein [Clostridia bacterium]
GNGGDVTHSTYKHVYDTTVAINDVTQATREGHTFEAFTSPTSGDTEYTTINNDTPSTLYAQWSINSYTITVILSNATVKVNGTAVSNNGTVSIQYGAQVTVEVTYSETESPSTTIKGTDGTTYESPFTMPAQDVTINASSESSGGFPCVAAGTLITMADGTTKKVENLKPGDMVLVFNHYKGEFEFMPVIYNIHDYEDWAYYDILYLYFDDGTTIKTHQAHCFLDMATMTYAEISNENVDSYIGHSFYAADFDGKTYKGKTIKLIGYEIVNEYTGVYGPITYGNLNCFAEGLLNIPADNDPFINTFVMNSNLKYDEVLMAKDIETYGLYTYEDFRPYISEDIYNAYNGQYIKVAVGKGYTTFDRVLELIDKYLKDMGYGEYVPTTPPQETTNTTDAVEATLPPPVVTGSDDNSGDGDGSSDEDTSE